MTKTGNFHSRSNFIRKAFRPVLVRARARAAAESAESKEILRVFPNVTFHALRHTHASMLLARGRNIREVSERLGHSSPELTLRVYAHLMPGMGKQTAGVLDVMFGSEAAAPRENSCSLATSGTRVSP